VFLHQFEEVLQHHVLVLLAKNLPLMILVIHTSDDEVSDDWINIADFPVAISRGAGNIQVT
jgi:hypothetical protein